MIELARVWRTYHVGGQEVFALRDVSLVVPDGQYVSIMGPSGSGKSTLLNVIGMLDRPTRGTYRLDGRDVTELDDDEQARVRRERIGFVFQSFHLVPRLDARQNVELPLVLQGVPPKERRTRVAAALEAFGLADRARHRPDELSGGQRQRTAIARATIAGPSVLLADEPTGNLDRKTGLEVLDVLESLNRRGITLIVVTHDQDIGQRASRRIRMLDGGIAEDAQ